MIRTRVLSAALTAALGAALLSGAVPSQAAQIVLVPNPTFATSTTGWTATSNATIKRIADSGATAGQVTPRSKSGTKTIGMVSTRSDAIAAIGTSVHAAGQVRTSQTGKEIIFQLRELAADGTVLQKFDGVTTPSTTGWNWTGAVISTTRTNSRVNLFISEVGVTSDRYLQVRAINADLTPPALLPSPKPTPSPTASPSPTPPPPPATCAAIDYSTSGRQVFGDEFTGTKVDTAKWRVRDGESLSFDKARILARNVTVHDGVLDIAGKRETVSSRDYTTGYVDTIGKFSQKYGRWEMRAMVPTDGTKTRGVWPAFWLRGDSTPGEIDIMETWGSPATRSFNPSTSNSWTIWRDTNDGGGDKFTGWSHPQGHSPPIYDAYHVYAVNWSPGCMTFSFDGTVVVSINTSRARWMTTSFDSPFNIRLNMQVGSGHWGYPDSKYTKTQFNYLVDYVRAYAPGP